jgi:hypothetical protein
MLLLSRTGFPVLSVRLTLAITWPQGVISEEEYLRWRLRCMAMLESGRSVRLKKR